MKQLLLSSLFLSGVFFVNAQTTTSNQAAPTIATETGVHTTSTEKDEKISQSFMPTDVIDITATTTETNGIVSWGSSGPRRTANFVVERSFDGKTFSAIQTVAAKSGDATYSITDAGVWNIAPSRVWYRLQIVDTNGNVTYSPTVELTGKP